MHPLRRRELLKPREGGLRGTEPGRDLLAPFLYARLSHVQPPQQRREREPLAQQGHEDHCERDGDDQVAAGERRDRKSTRLNSSHSQISYAVFCLKKKKT